MSESQQNNSSEQGPSSEMLMRFELFCTTRLETDKSILALSTAGLGLIVTLLTSSHIKDFYTLLIFILAAFFFLSCIVAILWIFDENASYIANPDADGSKLTKLDLVAKITFSIGIFLTLCASANVSINNVKRNIKEEVEMTDKKSSENNKGTEVNVTKKIFIGDSWEGANAILSQPNNTKKVPESNDSAKKE